MTQYAWVRNGSVIVTLPDPSPQTIEIAYPDMAALLTACPDDVGCHWLFDGTNWTDPATLPPPVPQSVSRYQAMAAMMATPSATTPGHTLLQDVTAACTAAGGLVLLAFQTAATFDRQGMFMLEMQAALGISDATLDGLFVAAAAISS
jgi:hypothetical protein